jgi:two-component sensor histidine kinase
VISYGYFVEHDSTMLFLIFAFPFYLLVLLFNHLNLVHLAVTVLFSVGTLVLTIFSIYSGEQSMTHIFYALTVIGLAILYRKGIHRTFYFINLGVTIACFSFVMITFEYNLFPGFVNSGNDVQSDQRINAFILVTTALIFSLVVVVSNSRQFNQIYRADKQKQLLLAELNHRVKNNMAIILSLIRLKRDGLDERSAEAFLNLENRISTMAIVHDDVYSGKGMTNVLVSAHIKKLLEGICSTYEFKKIDCAVDTDDSELTVTQAMPFAMILNELVVNSMKHAFDGVVDPRIEIRFHLNGNECVFEYKDNGVGFDPEKDIDQNSLGLDLVTSLAEQIDAKIKMESIDGFHFEMRFEVKTK